MLQDFLCTHRYKEFRDQANALRTPFILQTIIFTPTSVKYYNGGRLIKSAENDSTGNTSTTYSYDDKGQLISTLSLTVKNGQPSNEIQTNRLYDQILSQKDAYEYDKYGYLTQIVYQRILGNNQKTSGFLTCLYDKYGNQIDSNSYYEYDNTGQWICRTDREHPKEVERIQYIYK